VMKNRLCAEIPEVRNIHHLHVWGLNQERLMLTMHVVLGVQPLDSAGTVRSIKKILAAEFGISHSTIEIETQTCSDDSG